MCTLRAMLRDHMNGRLSAAQRVLTALALSTLAACATRFDQAPVVDRSAALGSQPPAQAIQPAAPLGPPPPGYYRVKSGDTLYRIALETGQNYRDIAAWNNLANPNQIEVDQLLRVVPPGTTLGAVTPGVATAPITNGGAVQSAPLTPDATPAPSQSAALPPVIAGNASAATGSPQPAAPSAGASALAAANASIHFAWPAKGRVLKGFDDLNNKGIDIDGTLGEPVKAAGDGRVVYAGNGLRGYGNLIIIKHNATYLTAYAHNRALMVKEGDSVAKGQKIAEMGSSDSDRVKLHFEVRRGGKPVDPTTYLPPQ